ncbi:MAG: Eco57I restriction-modification methylase domain-containing protein [Gaiellaceae bacterium]
MSTIRLPSLDVPEAEKRGFTEAEVHSKLFEPDMGALGYPARTSSQADGEHFAEQRSLAIRRLRSGRSRGFYDGLYLLGNSPVVLCELKRYEAVDSAADWERAKKQLIGYATSEDFLAPPPFLVLYCGKPDRNRFFRRKTLADPNLLGEVEYEELDEIWGWERIKEFQLRGEFALEQVSRERLLEILLYHLDRIEDDMRPQVVHGVQVVSDNPPAILTEFGTWLRQNEAARERFQQLYERKVAETGKPAQVVEEMTTQAALNYLNKVFFLNLCEDRNLPGFYRIMREFLPTTRSETSPTTAAVFLGMLRSRIRDSAGAWRPQEEAAYRALRHDLAEDIRERVIEQNNWWELIRVAFDFAEEKFPLVYREDAYDYFRPRKETLAELVYDLSTKSFSALTNRHVGDIYQGLLSSRRRRPQQARLGAFYTPHGDVEYMVSKLGLTRESRVLDPCMGSGHFLEGIYDHLAALYVAEGYSREDAYRAIVGSQLYGGDIDGFATSLSAIRLFLLDDYETGTPPHLYVHDMLLHSPERPQRELFTQAERAVPVDPQVDEIARVDEVEFDAVVGNPPYGARKPEYKKGVYARLYGQRDADRRAGSIATGDADSYAMFFANGIERLREGGRLCLITNDSFRTLTTHAALRRRILHRCKIVEILLTDTKHFEGVSFQFAGMAITTLEKCSDEVERRANVMRLVDYVREPSDFQEPSAEKVTALRQEEYEALGETPFFVGVPQEVFESAKRSERIVDVARGRQGLATADDGRFLADVGDLRVGSAGIAGEVDENERSHGIPLTKPYWVPFAKGGGFGDYWKEVETAIDWSVESVAELERRDALPAGTARRPRFQNRDFYFRPGLTYSVVSSGRVSVRLLPAGWIFGHKGSAIFVEDASQDERFLLGYLNSALATYFMKKLVNTTATADVGYIEKLPYRRPTPGIERSVVDAVDSAVASLQVDPAANIAADRELIDGAIFDLFEIRASRDEIRRFHRTVGRVEADDQAASE